MCKIDENGKIIDEIDSLINTTNSVKVHSEQHQTSRGPGAPVDPTFLPISVPVPQFTE